MAKNNQPDIYQGPSTTGAIYIPIHGERKVNIYPIQEHELKTIGICNNLVSLSASIGSACFALIAACLWDMATSEAASSPRAVAFIVACILVLAFSIVIATYFWKQKQSEIDRIKSETTTRGA